MKKCICQVCCCGRHRCPHNLAQHNRVINKSDLRSCHVTEYRQSFEDITPKRGPFRRPPDLIKQEGNMYDETTNATSYLPPRQTEPPKAKEREKFVPNPHKFDAVSEHRDNYKPVSGVPARMPSYLKSTTMRKPSAKFSYVSTKQDDFKAWQTVTCRHVAAPRENRHRAPSKPFLEISTHRQDFTRFDQPPNPSARQSDKLDFGDAPTDFQTTNRSFHKPLKAVVARPVERRVEDPGIAPAKTAFARTSVFSGDFVEHKAAKSAQMFRPVSLLFHTDERMNCETTQGDAFKEWPVAKAQRKVADVYKKPDGSIELVPTSRDYAHHGVLAAPAKSARPRTKLQRGREFPFNPTTSYSAEFKRHDNHRPPQKANRAAANAVNDIFPTCDEGAATVGTSEFLDKYRRHKLAPAKMFKGDSSLFQSSATFQESSLYRDQFRGETIDCPSEKLLRNDNVGAYSFDHVTEEGHKVYEISPRGGEHLRKQTTVA